jgi:DNA-binding transcriptional regulator of glucitol operon
MAQVNAFKEVSNSLSNQVDNHVFTVPSGKRLAIDYVSAKGTVPAGDAVSGIHTNNPVVHFFVVTAQRNDISGKSVFTAAQSFRTTIGPFSAPTDVVVRMERNKFGAGNEASLAVTLAGELS